jgi:2'-5' RNA ligase
MQRQLPGLGPHEVHNLFFALSPDETTRASIAAAADALRIERAPRGRWLKPPRYHLTLQFLGEHSLVSPDLVERACAAATAVQACTFEIVLDSVGSFGANKSMPVWLGCSEVPDSLQQLHHDLGRSLIKHGCRSFGAANLVPHVTILRDAEQVLQQPLSAPIRWRVNAFVLIDSCIQPPAPYRILGRWPLT